MEGYITFLDWKKQYCEKWLYSPKQSTDSINFLSNYKWHFFPHRITAFFFYSLYGHRRPWITKIILRKKNEIRWNNLMTSILLQSDRHQDSMVLAQKQKHRSIEHDRNSRDKLTHLCLPLFEKGGKHTMEKRQPLQYVVLKNWITTCKIMKLEHFL